MLGWEPSRGRDGDILLLAVLAELALMKYCLTELNRTFPVG